VFFSTHHLQEVEQIADHVVLLARGRRRLQGPLDEIKERNRRVQCVVERDGPLPTEVAAFRRDGRTLTGFSTEDPERLAEVLPPYGIRVVASEPATLKEVFFEQAAVKSAQEVRA
jgi:ABC-type uncharacterized transport system ATPase subunit